MSDSSSGSSGGPPEGSRTDASRKFRTQVAVVRPMIHGETTTAAEDNASTSESNPQTSVTAQSTSNIVHGTASASNQSGEASGASSNPINKDDDPMSLSSDNSSSDSDSIMVMGSENTDYEPSRRKEPVASTSGRKTRRSVTRGRKDDPSPSRSASALRGRGVSARRTTRRPCKHARRSSSKEKKSPQRSQSTSEPPKKEAACSSREVRKSSRSKDATTGEGSSSRTGKGGSRKSTGGTQQSSTVGTSRTQSSNKQKKDKSTSAGKSHGSKDNDHSSVPENDNEKPPLCREIALYIKMIVYIMHIIEVLTATNSSDGLARYVTARLVINSGRATLYLTQDAVNVMNSLRVDYVFEAPIWHVTIHLDTVYLLINEATNNVLDGISSMEDMLLAAIAIFNRQEDPFYSTNNTMLLSDSITHECLKEISFDLEDTNTQADDVDDENETENTLEEDQLLALSLQSSMSFSFELNIEEDNVADEQQTGTTLTQEEDQLNVPPNMRLLDELSVDDDADEQQTGTTPTQEEDQLQELNMSLLDEPNVEEDNVADEQQIGTIQEDQLLALRLLSDMSLLDALDVEQDRTPNAYEQCDKPDCPFCQNNTV